MEDTTSIMELKPGKMGVTRREGHTFRLLAAPIVHEEIKTFNKRKDVQGKYMAILAGGSVLDAIFPLDAADAEVHYSLFSSDFDVKITPVMTSGEGKKVSAQTEKEINKLGREFSKKLVSTLNAAYSRGVFDKKDSIIAGYANAPYSFESAGRFSHRLDSSESEEKIFGSLSPVISASPTLQEARKYISAVRGSQSLVRGRDTRTDTRTNTRTDKRTDTRTNTRTNAGTDTRINTRTDTRTNTRTETEDETEDETEEFPFFSTAGWNSSVLISSIRYMFISKGRLYNTVLIDIAVHSRQHHLEKHDYLRPFEFVQKGQPIVRCLYIKGVPHISLGELFWDTARMLRLKLLEEYFVDYAKYLGKYYRVVRSLDGSVRPDPAALRLLCPNPKREESDQERILPPDQQRLGQFLLTKYPQLRLGSLSALRYYFSRSPDLEGFLAAAFGAPPPLTLDWVSPHRAGFSLFMGQLKADLERNFLGAEWIFRRDSFSVRVSRGEGFPLFLVRPLTGPVLRGWGIIPIQRVGNLVEEYIEETLRPREITGLGTTLHLLNLEMLAYEGKSGAIAAKQEGSFSWQATNSSWLGRELSRPWRGAERTGLENDFRDTGVSNDFRDTGLENNFRDTGLENDFGDTGLENDFGDTGLENNFRDTGLENDFRDTGLENNFRDTGLENDFRDTGVSNNFRDTGVSNNFRDTGVSNNFRDTESENQTLRNTRAERLQDFRSKNSSPVSDFDEIVESQAVRGPGGERSGLFELLAICCKALDFPPYFVQGVFEKFC